MSGLCVIIPCYNEAKRLPIEEYLKYLNTNQTNFCFVNDGSSDTTIELLENIKKAYPSQVLVLDQHENKGKAEAVRAGVLKSLNWKDFDFLCYFDADLAVPLSEIPIMLEYASNHSQFLLFMGVRLKRLGASIKRKPFRHFIGRIFATFVSNLFRMDAYDTQCGFKLFRAEIGTIVFDRPFYSKWFFDIEVLLRFKAKINEGKSFDKICELTINEWDEIGGSKLKLIDFLSVPFELLRLKIKYKNKKIDACNISK